MPSAPTAVPPNAFGGMPPARPVSMPVQIIGHPSPLQEIVRVPAVPQINPPNWPEYCRSSLTRVPRNSAVAAKTKLSFGLTVSPFPHGADPVPVAPLTSPILRCSRCRTYLNPYAEVIDSGSRWKCNLCYQVNEFPAIYDYDPATQQPHDRRAKPELNYPVYEFVAPAEYMVRPPQPPAYVFLLDATYAAVSSGMMATALRTILDSLDAIPNTEGRTRIAFITYDSGLHFYSFANGEPRMLVVSDLEEPFLPSDESDLLVSLTDAKAHVEALLAAMPGYFANTQATQSALGAALSSAIKLLGNIGGKVVVLQSSPPSVGEGAIKPRDDPKLYGTSAESALLRPQLSFYKVQATECSRVQVCVDMFLCPPASLSLDIATVGCAARYTGGKIFYYPGFNAASRPEDAMKLASDLSSFVGKEVAFESVIRIRASQGLSVNAYYGNFFLRSSDLLALPNVNPDHSYSAQIILEDNLNSPIVCFQTAVLHTTCHGERRIRVINAAYPVTEIPEEVFDGVDLGATVDLLSKMALEKAINGSLEEARDALTNKVIELAKAIRAQYKLGSSGQLMFIESLRLLPLLVCGLLRTPAFKSGTSISVDSRSYFINILRTSSVAETLDLVYPFFFAVNALEPEAGLPDAETGKIVLPARMALSSEKLERHGLYVIDNGLSVVIWVGSQVHPELASLIFGQPYAELDSGKYSLLSLENPWSQRLGNILSKRRATRAYAPTTYLVKEDCPDPGLKMMFLGQLVEDRTMDGQLSFAQWLNIIREKSSA